MLMRAVHVAVESRVERVMESNDSNMLSVAVVGLLISRAIDVFCGRGRRKEEEDNSNSW